MKKFLGYGLALALVLSLCVTQAWARGGGHGGGHHGGGHHGGHHSGHHGHHSHHHTGHHDHHHSHHGYHHHSHWANHNRPFSHGWYGNHGGAWGGGWGGGYGWGNPWGVANWGTTAAWLGLGAATTPLLGSYGNTYATSDTTYTADNGTTDNGTNNQTPTTLTSDTSSDESPETLSAAANELASKGTTEPGQDEKFLPLGVFSLAPHNQTEASALLQLAVSKDGVLRGTYYDLLSNEDHPIRGSVDKKTQRVAWTFGNKGKVTFQTALANLTEPSGKVSVHYENGQTREWVLARYEKEPSENDAKEEATEDADDKDEAADSTKPGDEATDSENDKDDDSDDDGEEEEKETPTAGDKPFPGTPTTPN